MKIVFFGSDNFAVAPLRALLNSGHNISCIVTQPDKKSGRGLSIGVTPVKEVAQQAGIQIYQPTVINEAKAVRFLKGFNADLFVVIAYGQILCEELLALPRLMALNLHASLLPKYRGAAPINWVLINGEKQTGISIIKIIKKMDAGPLIIQKPCSIEEEDTAVSLSDKLSRLGAGLLLDAVRTIANHDYNLTPQKEEEVTLAPKLKKQDGLIDWNKTALEISNLIRGCLDWPGAFSYYKSKLLKIHKAKPDFLLGQVASSLPGEIINAAKNGIIVATGRGNLIMEELQIEGKRVMSAEEFLSGHKVNTGEVLTKK